MILEPKDKHMGKTLMYITVREYRKGNKTWTI